MTYDTWVVRAWITRAPSWSDVIAFRDRVLAEGRKNNATRTGIIVVLAKHLKSALEAAVREHADAHEPDLRKALFGEVDWFAIAESVLDAPKA